MEIPARILQQLGVTEAELREVADKIEIPQFAADTRRVEFQLVDVDSTSGGAATLFADMRLVSMLDGQDDGHKYAVFMRAAPSVNESEELRIQQAIDKIFAGKEAEGEVAEEEESSNVISFLNAMGKPEEDE